MLSFINYRILQYLFISIFFSFLLNACKTTQKASVNRGAEEIIVPFSSKEFRSNTNFFRAKQSGSSPNLATAKKIALQNAKAELASNIESLLKRVTDQYTNQRTVANNVVFENKFEELSRDVVKQKLNNISQIGEKVFKEKNNSYTYWIVIEVDKKTILDGVNSNISTKEQLKLD